MGTTLGLEPPPGDHRSFWYEYLGNVAGEHQSSIASTGTGVHRGGEYFVSKSQGDLTSDHTGSLHGL
ncbi:hypothetical protein SDC9_111093 [bioreactor metagenome]|uniref:Uncharacterized protein n=1 Tax=bioreactor metagenome TaxID=1076179 RepID=A0A645BFU1_9ZZZZ